MSFIVILCAAFTLTQVNVQAHSDSTKKEKHSSNSQSGVKLFQYVRPAVGFGLRLMVNKHFRTNINIDFAIGKESKGFYFSGQ